MPAPKLAPLALAGLALAAPAHPGPPPSAEDDLVFDYAALAEEYLEELGQPRDGLRFHEWIDGAAFVRFGIGSLEVRAPRSALAEKRHAEDLEEAAQALVDLMDTWHGWNATPAAEGDPPLAEDWDVLRKWINGWSAKKLSKVGGGPETLYDSLDADEEVRAAQERLAAATRPNPPMREYVGETNVIVIAPTRRDFLALLAVGGLVDPAKRDTLWSGKNLGRTAAWFDWVEILCPVKAGVPIDPVTPFASHSMKNEGETGALQFLVDRTALLLLRKEFYPNGTHFFEVTLGTNLVIDVVGENDQYAGDWKLEYRTSGSSTRPYTRFVPGGNPAGGVLPARRAGPGATSGSAVEVSSYRKGGGKEFFKASLKEGQKNGAKLAAKDKDRPFRRDSTAHFELFSFETNEHTVVTAPFLGDQGEDKVLPPNEFLDDYEDFFRAYRACFFHWLQVNGAGEEDEAPALFAELLRRQAQRAVDVPFHRVVAEVYGVPLSSPDPETDALEWRFLGWLKKR